MNQPRTIQLVARLRPVVIVVVVVMVADWPVALLPGVTAAPLSRTGIGVDGIRIARGGGGGA